MKDDRLDDKVVYTRLSMGLLKTLEKHSTMRWSNGMAPTRLFPNLKGQEISVFAWKSGVITWSHLHFFERDARYLKVKPDEFLRWCVGRFAREV